MFNNITRNICTASEFIDQGSDRRFVRRREGRICNFLAARLDFFRTVQQEGQSITDFLAELRNKAK